MAANTTPIINKDITNMIFRCAHDAMLRHAHAASDYEFLKQEAMRLLVEYNNFLAEAHKWIEDNENRG